ncbi:OmpA family protein [uncultured Cohaesibacter sp.]|uniref:OmpA family protein n=1 Tax=uncultured Cohaesibacter sp. TaxID=1002546 RepID=UPI002AA6FEAA|nr:OmpA family protein [uncultured Cohaesibacter sp.]
MRPTRSARQQEVEEESVFISMTDMTVSFLFIVMILLAFFASQYVPEATNETPNDPLSKEQLLQLNEELTNEQDRLKTALMTNDLRRSQMLKEYAKQSVEKTELISKVSLLEAQLDATKRLLTELGDQSDMVARVQDLLEQLTLARHQLSQKKVNPLEQYNLAASKALSDLLQSLRDRIDRRYPDLKVEISATKDALRFKGEGLFASGQFEPTERGKARIKDVAQMVSDILGCFTLGENSHFSESCNPSYALIEALQVEGHTDSDGPDEINIPLSANRGASTYLAMTQYIPELTSYLNFQREPVISVAGYGENRPVDSNLTDEGKSANRRIDLRFIMTVPPRLTDLQAIRHALSELETGK